MSEVPNILWNSIRHFFEKYLLIFSVSYKISSSPYSFGKNIENSPKELKNSIGYVAEFYLLFFLLIQLISGSLPFLGVEKLPLATEILALGFVVGIVSLAISVAWVAGLMSKSERKYYSTVAAHLYWYGFIQLLYLLFMPLQIVLSKEEGWLMLLSLLPMAGMIYTMYCFPTLFRWVGDINGVSWLKGFFAYWLGAFVWAVALTPILLFFTK